MTRLFSSVQKTPWSLLPGPRTSIREFGGRFGWAENGPFALTSYSPGHLTGVASAGGSNLVADGAMPLPAEWGSPVKMCGSSKPRSIL